MLFKIAFRNLAARPLRSLALGGIIAFGAFLAVLAGSLADSMTASLRRSLTRSIVGDLQIYSDQAKEDFSLFSANFAGRPRIGSLPDFGRLRRAILAGVPAVQDMVPEGIDYALVNPGNILDVKLEELRGALKARPRDRARLADLKAHLRSIVAATDDNFRRNLLPSGLVADDERAKDEAAFRKALSPAFWKGFDAAPEAAAEFLGNAIAPLIFENTMLPFSYIGTVPGRMAKAFPLVEVVRGQMIPQGSPGFMINDYFYETQVKHRMARRLDDIHAALAHGRETLKGSKGLQALVRSNVEQVDEILSQLSPANAAAVDAGLRAALPAAAGAAGLRERLQAFFLMDDGNFAARYDLFYRLIAPRIILYHVNVGDIFPLKTFTEAGFANAVNVKVWGTFRFRNFEHSPLAGNFNLLDLQSFRDLYGFDTPQRRAENRALEAEMAAAGGDLGLGQDQVEGLFRRGRPAGAAKAKAAPRPKAQIPAPAPAAAGGDPEDGPCLNAAVVLKPGADAGAAQAAIQALNQSQHLGIRVVGWEQAAGLLGQLVKVLLGLLYGLIAVILVVGAFIIQNALFMATVERTTEIGTLRAIGASRRLVMKLVFAEALALSLAAGAAGALAGLGLTAWLGRVGIPAPAEQVTFLFSGRRLYLVTRPAWALGALGLAVAISLAASLYPAWKANQITPLKAMQKE